jgi:lysosomal alpha-mannosidase
VRREQNLIIPWGCDFTFSNAKLNYDQIDDIISYVNKHNGKNITLVQSTPSDYIKAIKEEEITW